ncbi:MAG TPA: hypothetical protein ENL10_03445 [Candidatus Cloacimonetes bacterium]|nr:hypothetical protein [Candidatus Cloacimonadota bacterium]
MVREFTDLGDIFEEYYINGAKLARKWNNRFGRLEENENNSLKDFARYLGVTYKSDATPARWIRYVRERSQNKESFQDVSPRGQEDWQKLLAYNKKDCEVLRDLMIAVSEDYQAEDT